MTQDMNLLQLTVEQRAQAMAVFDECADLREFGCRMLEAVMNAVMDADAQDTCGATRGERSEARENSRNGYRPRTLRTAAGDLELAIPKLRRGTYYPEGILGRYTRVEASMVALVREMYVAGVSTRKVERVAEGLGVSSLSSSEVSRLCSELDESAAEPPSDERLEAARLYAAEAVREVVDRRGGQTSGIISARHRRKPTGAQTSGFLSA